MESPTVFACSRLLESGLRVTTTPPGRCGRRFLDENSPVLRSPSTYTIVVKQRNLFHDSDEADNSSQDSAFSEGAFRFLEPKGFAPQKSDSPRRCLRFPSENSWMGDSGCSEDGFSELQLQDEESRSLPPTVDTLLGANTHLNTPGTPGSRKRRISASHKGRAKRSRPLADRASQENKGTLFQYGFTRQAKKEEEVQAISQSALHIELALQRSTQEELIGDFSRPFALPLMPGKHQDLKTISSETLANLINGDYEDVVASYKIVDCRYPYEYNGGHIKGAVNLYTCNQILKDLLDAAKSESPVIDASGKRHIIILHCEFSSERGPFLSRFLRKEDRAGHEYPNLAFPELYLLHGGYKAFFADHQELCLPQTYRTMHDPNHTGDLKHFKAKSKSWAPGSHRKLTIRSLSRLGF